MQMWRQQWRLLWCWTPLFFLLFFNLAEKIRKNLLLFFCRPLMTMTTLTNLTKKILKRTGVNNTFLTSATLYQERLLHPIYASSDFGYPTIIKPVALNQGAVIPSGVVECCKGVTNFWTWILYASKLCLGVSTIFSTKEGCLISKKVEKHSILAVLSG